MHTQSMRVLAAIATGVSLSVVLEYGLNAQSDAARRAASKEWPTYGHDAEQHAVLAADRDHACQRRRSQGRVGVSHEAGAA